MNSIFLDTLNKKDTHRPPVWFMRQAGRILPSYQALKKMHSFSDLMNNPELAAKVTLLPINDLGVDAAILFSDILIVPEALGMGLEFTEKGPIFSKPLTQFEKPSEQLIVDRSKLTHVYDNIDEIINIRPENTPLIGFCEFIDTKKFCQVFNILIFKYIFCFSNFIVVSLLVYENYKLSISNQQLMNEIFLLILIHITFYLFPITISFTLYFIFLHSIKVLKQEFDYLKSLQSNLNLHNFIKLLCPHTILSIVFLVIFLLLMNFEFINISVFLFSIIGISVITLPHAIIMTNFYNEN